MPSAFGHDAINSNAAALPLEDGLLLDRFIKSGDPAAFEALMQRHGPYLLGVCRRLTGYAQDAEDVFQASFLELVRQASRIRSSGSVAGWLQTVAVRLARKSKSKRLQQQRRESEAAKPITVAPDDLSWREACRILEEELARLPEELRSPIILCFFEGQTQDEAAQSLKINPRTLKDRLKRGRDRLGQRLVRRGVSLAILGALLSGGSAHVSVAASLTQNTLQGAAAVVKASPLTGLVSPSVLGLIGASWLKGWSAVAAVCLAVVLSLTAAITVWQRNAAIIGRERPLHTVTRSFTGKQFDPQFFKWSGPTPQKYIRREDEGLRITLPATDGPGEPLGIAVRPIVHGDFEVELTLEWLHVQRPARGFGAGVTVYCYLDSPDRDGVWFGKMDDPKQGAVFSAGHRLNTENGRGDAFVKKMPAVGNQRFARLRLVRRGANFSLWGGDGVRGDFHLLGEFPISDADVSVMRFAADPAWSKSAAVDARLIRVTVSAEEFVGYEQ